MKIVIGSDHAGFEHKKKISELIASLGHDIIDVGTYDEDSVDYPDYGEKGAREICCGQAELGVLVCGTGIGISMAANKVKGIRAAVCWNEETASLTRQHNDANILCIGARFIPVEDALNITKVFLDTPASKDKRHQRRIGKISNIEERSISCDCK
ncbi:ribose 5-phosphate isomerase B [Actinomycetota bacterium]